jgi:hypothetical protein
VVWGRDNEEVQKNDFDETVEREKRTHKLEQG